MRVLVITRAPWRNDNNTGNTLTNFFKGMNDIEFYNLYFRDQLPDNNITKKNFSISERQLVNNLLKRTPVGKEVIENSDSSVKAEENLYSFAKRKGSMFLMWLRDVLWSIGNWKKDSLIKFVQEINPDIIFVPMFCCTYPYRVLQFIRKYTNAKLVLFHPDDNYTLKQFSLSPLYWFYRFNLRKWVRRTVKISDINYAISNIQKEDYEKAFNRPFKILTKGIDFSDEPKKKDEYNKPLQLVFTGNIGMNRWKSLGVIASTLEKINADGLKAQLKIYTASPLTEKIEKALNIEGSSQIMGYVASSKIAEIQSNADILIHVEATDLRNKLLVRQSFSTKIVDYLYSARPILAYGPKDVASIDHLVKNDCAIVADNENELYEKLMAVIDDNSLFDLLVEKSYECGKKYHNEADINTMLKNDLNFIVNK